MISTNPHTIRNLLIVESHNDAAFIRLLLQDLGISADIDVVIEDLHIILKIDNSN